MVLPSFSTCRTLVQSLQTFTVHLPHTSLPLSVTSAAFSSARALTQKTSAKTANVAQSFLIVEPPLVTEPVRTPSDPVSDVWMHELPARSICTARRERKRALPVRRPPPPRMAGRVSVFFD